MLVLLLLLCMETPHDVVCGLFTVRWIDASSRLHHCGELASTCHVAVPLLEGRIARMTISADGQWCGGEVNG